MRVRPRWVQWVWGRRGRGVLGMRDPAGGVWGQLWGLQLQLWEHSALLGGPRMLSQMVLLLLLLPGEVEQEVGDGGG